jgi:hypothetical protein
MVVALARPALVCLSTLTAFIALATGCTAPVQEKEVTEQQKEDLSLWKPIGTIEEVDINASADVIWRDLLTVSCYSHWNPWLTTAADTTHPAQGAEIEVGDTVTATAITATGAQAGTEKVTIAAAPGTPGQPAGQVAQLCWRDAIPVASCLVPAYRCRTLTANSDGSIHVKNDLELEGVIDWLAFAIESSSFHKGMYGENHALKSLAESGTLDPLTCQTH